MGYNAPLNATAKYVRNLNDYGQDEFDKLWLRFSVDEEENRSIFTNINKLKIMNTAINELMVVHNLIYKGHVTAFFPLHNEFDMLGFNRLRPESRTDDQEARIDKKEALVKKNLTKVQEQFKGIMTHGYEYVKELRTDLSDDWTMLRIDSEKGNKFKPWLIFLPPCRFYQRLLWREDRLLL